MTGKDHIAFSDETYDGQFGRTMTMATVDGADLGEAFAAARDMGKPTAVSWHDAWSARADQARDDAETAVAAGDPVSARGAWLRAAEYARQASYFLRSDLADPRLLDAYRRHVDAFERALALLPGAEQVWIPYEGTTLKGYFFTPAEPADAGRARPTVLMPCGYDSTAEYGYIDVPAALERGYNALVFEGPGQGQALIEQRLFFRPDFEAVLTPVVDWVLTRPEVDPAALVVIGRSFAGYLAPRGATAEHRLAALVCDPGQPAMGDKLPEGIAGKVAPAVVGAQMKMSAERAEFFGSRMACHGVTEVADYFAEMRRFEMLSRAGSITCPTLVIESEGDPVGGGGQKLVDALTVPATLVNLTAKQGAGGHCAGIGQHVWQQTVYGWLAGVLHRRAPDA